MKAYLITTGTLFGVLALVHIWRAIDAEPKLATDPWYILVTLVAAAMSRLFACSCAVSSERSRCGRCARTHAPDGGREGGRRRRPAYHPSVSSNGGAP